MYQDLNELFDKRLSRYIAIIEKHLRERLADARDRQYVANEIKNEVHIMETLMTSTPKAKEFTRDFLAQYEQGINIASIVNRLKQKYGNNDAFFSKHIDTSKPLVVISDDENERISTLVSNDRSLVKFLTQFIAIQELKKRLPDLLKTETPESEMKNTIAYPVEWTTSKDNKTEFVQLIYALHGAGYLNNGRGEITKIVESLAGVLGVSLSKNWQSNLSASVHRSNSDYQPSIFNKIAAAYSEYADKLISAKQNNK